MSDEHERKLAERKSDGMERGVDPRAIADFSRKAA